MVHLRRYYLGPDWTPKKLEVLVDMPDRLSLQNLRAIGQQASENSLLCITYHLSALTLFAFAIFSLTSYNVVENCSRGKNYSRREKGSRRKRQT
jgi:hypothetical protein